MTLNTQVIVLHSFSYLLSRHNIDTFGTFSVSVSEEEKEIIHLICFLMNKVYTDFNHHIDEDISMLKKKHENFTYCLEDIFLNSFPYGIQWSHIIGYIILMAEATVCYFKENSDQNIIHFASSTLWLNFEKYLNVWIQENGGWFTLQRMSSIRYF